MRSILLVGEQNPHGANPDMALHPYPAGGSGGRLVRILRLSVDDYLSDHDRMNLCYGAWSRSEAWDAAMRVLDTRPRGSGIVLLGRKAEDVFGFVYPRYWVRHLENNLYVLALPHPSGLCREWNDPANLNRAYAAYQDLRRAVGLSVSPVREVEPSAP